MKTNLTLAWRLLRGGGRSGVLGSALTVVAVAATTALLLAAVAANVAFDARADRTAWRTPERAGGDQAVAVQATGTDVVRGERLQVVDLAAADRASQNGKGSENGHGSAAAGAANLPAPPGMQRFPEPGELWVSPALADRMEQLPASQLADRFPGSEHPNILGSEALSHPDELVAVVGRASDAPALNGNREGFRDGTSDPTPIAAFSTTPDERAVGYRVLALIATVLVLVPLLVFGGAAARLTVARRDQRLATLRLVGATPGQVTAVTVAESVLTALAGALLGAGCYLLGIPGLQQIQVSGGTWYAADVWVGVLALLAVVLAVPALVGVSAVAGLRRVVVSPLGVARRQTPPGLRAVRLLVFGVAVVGCLMAARMNDRLGIALFVLFLGLSFLALNLVGPWVVALLGKLLAGLARRPAALLAGRRLSDDPRSAWRSVAGVALIGFTAGFTTLFGASDNGEADRTLQVTVAQQQATDAVADLRQRVADEPALAGAQVRTEQQEGSDVRRIQVEVAGNSAAALDRARTSLNDVVPGRPLLTATDLDLDGDVLLADIRTGTLTVLVASFLLGMVSAGIASASSVLDRRQTFALLRMAGTPLKVIDAARRRETLVPLAVMGGGSLLTGVLLALPLLGSGMDLSGAPLLLATVVLGFCGVWAASELSRPLLRSVTAHATPRPD